YFYFIATVSCYFICFVFSHSIAPFCFGSPTPLSANKHGCACLRLYMCRKSISVHAYTISSEILTNILLHTFFSLQTEIHCCIRSAQFRQIDST
uniref:Secreted protein n=1 Tax=Parascaris univalens TaxID=6257 RepID=A0A915BHI8_PARUN